MCALQVNIIVALQWEISLDFLSISLENTFVGLCVAHGLRRACTFSAGLSLPAASPSSPSAGRLLHTAGSLAAGVLYVTESSCDVRKV